MARYPNPDRKKHQAILAEMRDNKASRQEMADTIGMSKSYVGEMLQELGLTRKYKTPAWRKNGVTKNERWLVNGIHRHHRLKTPLAEQAAALGISESYVSYLRKQLGLVRRKPHTTAANRPSPETIAELRKTSSMAEIAKRFQVTEATILNWLKPNRSQRPFSEIAEEAMERKKTGIRVKKNA